MNRKSNLSLLLSKETREGRRCFDGITGPSPIESIDAGLLVLGGAVGKSPGPEANGLFARRFFGIESEQRREFEVAQRKVTECVSGVALSGREVGYR